jgi:hypothetical protein
VQKTRAKVHGLQNASTESFGQSCGAAIWRSIGPQFLQKTRANFPHLHKRTSIGVDSGSFVVNTFAISVLCVPFRASFPIRVHLCGPSGSQSVVRQSLHAPRITNHESVNKIFQQKLQRHAAIRSLAQRGAVLFLGPVVSPENGCYSHPHENQSTASETRMASPDDSRRSMSSIGEAVLGIARATLLTHAKLVPMQRAPTLKKQTKDQCNNTDPLSVPERWLSGRSPIHCPQHTILNFGAIWCLLVRSTSDPGTVLTVLTA